MKQVMNLILFMIIITRSKLKTCTCKVLILLLVNLMLYANIKAQNYGIIKGKITDINTKESIVFASVALFKNGEQFSATLTDEDGNYKFECPEGNYLIEVYDVEYEKKETGNIKIKKDSTIELDIPIKNINYNDYNDYNDYPRLNTRMKEIFDKQTGKKNICCSYYETIPSCMDSGWTEYKITFFEPDSLTTNVIYKLPSPYFEVDIVIVGTIIVNKYPINNGYIVFHKISIDNMILSLILYNHKTIPEVKKEILLSAENISFMKGNQRIKDNTIDSNHLFLQYKKEKNFNKKK